MKEVQKKLCKGLTAFVLVLLMFTGMIPTELFTMKADANTVHIYQRNQAGTNPPGYCAFNNGNPRFPVRTISPSGGACAYCMDHNKDTPGSGITYTRQSDVTDNGYLYIFNHGLVEQETWLGKNVDGFFPRYYVTQVAFTAYNGQTSNSAGWSSTPGGIADYARKLLNGAKNCHSLSEAIGKNSSSNCSVKIKFANGSNATDHELFEEGNTYRTKELKVDYEGDKCDITLTPTNKNKVSDITAKLKKKVTGSNKFYYAIKTSQITDVISVKITATAKVSLTYYGAGRYTPSDSRYQPFLIPEPKNDSDSKSDSITVKLESGTVEIEKKAEKPTDSGKLVSDASPNAIRSDSNVTLVDGKGFTFKVTGPKKTVDKTTNAKGEWKIKPAQIGDYTVLETNLPDYYYPQCRYKVQGGNWTSWKKSKSMEFPVKPGKLTTLQYTNFLKRGSLVVQKKIDPEKYVTEGYESLKGYTFRLTGTADCGYVYNITATTGADGKAEFKNLYIGTYTVTEELTSTQQRFYAKQNPQTNIRVGYNKVKKVTFINKLKTGDLVITKTSEDGMVAGVQFYLYGTPLAYEETKNKKYLEDYARGVKVATTDASGVAKFTDILIGHYTIEEVYPGKDKFLYKYIKPDNQDVTIEWNTTAYAAVHNKLKRGNLKVYKWAEDGVLAGRKFHLTGVSLSGSVIDEVRYTDETGVACFNDILISGARYDEVDPDTGEPMPGADNWYTLTEEDIPNRYYSQGYDLTYMSDKNPTPVKNKTQTSVQVQITYSDEAKAGNTSEAKFYNLLKRGDVRIVKRCEDDLVLGLTFRLNFVSEAYQDTGKEWITDGTITDTTMDLVDPVPGDSNRSTSDWQHRHGTLAARNGKEQLKGYYTKTTKDSGPDVEIGTTVINGVTWKTATIYFRDIPISGTEAYTVEELNTPTRYIWPYEQSGKVTWENNQNGMLEFKFHNELKRGSLEIKKTSEDGFVQNMTFKLSGTTFAWYQAALEKSRNKVGSVPYTVYGKADTANAADNFQQLEYFEVYATTDANGIARFENLPITWDQTNESDKYVGQYTIEEVNTKTRYIQPATQTTPIIWNEQRYYKEGGPGDGHPDRWKNDYKLYFYNQLKRGDLEIRKTSEDGFLQGFKFRLTGEALAKRQTDASGEVQTGDCIPPDTTLKPAVSYVTDRDYHEKIYNIDYIEVTNEQGIAKFADIPISDDAGTLTLSSSLLSSLSAGKHKLVITPAGKSKQEMKIDVKTTSSNYNAITWNSGSLDIELHDQVTGAVKVELDGRTLGTGEYSISRNVDGTAWEYIITEVDTPRRYIMLPNEHAPILWKDVVETYEPANRSFYNRLKRGKIVIQKNAETVDPNTRQPIDEKYDLSGYTFKITAKSLAAIESGVNIPPEYYGRYGKDEKGNLTSQAGETCGYETEYYATTNKEGIAVFDDILINDYLFKPKTDAELAEEKRIDSNIGFLKEKPIENNNNDIGNYINKTTGWVDLDEGTVAMIYYYEVEEINTSPDFMQPDKQYIQVKWYNDITDDGRFPGRINDIDLYFGNQLKTFRAVVEKQDSETGPNPQGEATLVGAKYGLYYNGKLLKTYESQMAETLIENDSSLSSVLQKGHVYIVTDYYACGDGYTLKELTPPKGYNISKEVIKIDAKSDRLLAADRYDRLHEKTEYTIVGARSSDGGSRYIAYEDVLKVKLNVHKTIDMPGENHVQPEYCIEFKIYPIGSTFKWNEKTEGIGLTTEDPLLQDVNDPEFNPKNYKMDDLRVREQIEIQQKSIRQRVQAYAKDQDYLITNVNGNRISVELPYGGYVVEQVTAWVSSQIAPPMRLSANELFKKQLDKIDAGEEISDADEDVKSFEVLHNRIHSQHIRVVKTDSNLSRSSYTDEQRVIKLSGFKFKLWDVNNNCYVPVKYTNDPINPPEYIMETDENGVAFTEDEIIAGDYEIHEIDAATGFARAKWENGEVLRIALGYSEECFDDNGNPLETVTYTFDNTAQKGIIKLFKQGERLTTVTTSSITTGENIKENIYGLKYENVGLEGATFDIYAVEGTGSFKDIPSDMLQYAKPIVASNSDKSPRYVDEFGKALDTKHIPVDTITTTKTGYATSKELYNGLYRIVETSAPDGMLLDETPRYVYINNNNQELKVAEYNVKVTDDRQKVRFKVEKSMEQNEKYGIGFSGEVTEVVFGLYAKTAVTALDGTQVPANGLISTVTMKSTDVASGLGSGTFNVDVPAGRYYIREIKTHEAYNIDTAKYDVTFDYFANAKKNGSYTTGKGVTYKVDANGYIELKPVNPNSANNGTTLENTIKYGKICGYKVKLGDHSIKIRGALFGLFKPDTTEFTKNNALETCYSDASGYFEFNNVPYGKWILKEILTPVGYVMTNSSTQNVNLVNNEQIITYEIDNEKIVGNIFLKKYDGSSGLNIKNHTNKKAYFTLYIDQNNNKKYDRGEPVYGTTSGYSTDENGELLITNVPYGNYVLMESAAPDGYLLDRGMYPVSITQNGVTYYVTNTTKDNTVVNGGNDAGNIFVNERQLGTLRINKKALPLNDVILPDGTIGQVVDVDNIRFRIESVSNPFNAKLIFEAVTDKNGVAVFKDIPVGTYRLTEISSDANKIYNLKLSEGLVKVEYDAVTELVTEKDITNYPIYNKLRIIKYAPDGGDLSNIKFKITGTVNGTNKILKYVDINQNFKQYGDHGKMSVTEIDLVIGEYTIEEILDSDIFVKPENQKVILNDMTLSYDENLEALNGKSDKFPVKTVEFTNYLKTLGNLRIEKYGENPDDFADEPYTENTGSQIKLPGVSFIVEGDPDSEYEDVRNFRTIITTSLNGIATLERIHIGKYFVTELHNDTYEVKFKGLFTEDEAIIERAFAECISPETADISEIRAALKAKLEAIGITDTNDIINKIVNAVMKLKNNPSQAEAPQSYEGDNYSFTVTKVGTKGNVGYVVDTVPKTVEIIYNKDNPQGTYEWSGLRFDNKLETSSLRIIKTSEDDRVDGVTYLVAGYSDAGVYCEYTLTADNVETIYNAEKDAWEIASVITKTLLAGKYTVKEISKTQYDLDDIDDDGDTTEEIDYSLDDDGSIYVKPDDQTVEIVYDYNGDETVKTVNVHNTLKRGNLRIVKVAEDRQKGNLAGFLFKVSAQLANGTSFEKYYRTDENGEINIENIVVGKYTVEEQTEDENGNKLPIMYAYLLPDSQWTQVSENSTAVVTVKNELERGPLKIVKTSVDGKVEGVKFLVEGIQKNGEKFSKIYVTDKNGIIMDDIVAGEYTITEILGPKTPYKTPKVISVVIDKDGYTAYSVTGDPDDEISAGTPTDATPTDPVIRVGEFYNEYAYGSIMITKTTSDNGPLEGFEFRIYGRAYNGQLVDIIIRTDKDGIASTGDIPVGEYTVTEIATEASAKYVLPSSQKVIVLENTCQSLDFFNKLITGAVRVEKIGSDKKVLANAEFTLYDENRNVYKTFVTDSNGIGELKNIPYGVYYLRETVAPKGYKLNNNIYRVVIDEQDVVKKFLVINKKEKDREYDDVPYTGYEFTADKGNTSPVSAPVSTGDTTNNVPTLTVMLIALFAAVVTFKKRRSNV